MPGGGGWIAALGTNKLPATQGDVLDRAARGDLDILFLSPERQGNAASHPVARGAALAHRALPSSRITFLAVDRPPALEWFSVHAQPSCKDASPKPRAGSPSRPTINLYRDNGFGLRSGRRFAGWFAPEPLHRLQARRIPRCSARPR